MRRCNASLPGGRKLGWLQDYTAAVAGAARLKTADNKMANRYDEIYHNLSELLGPYAGDNQTIEPSTRLVDDLGLDSVQVMELLMELEDRLDTAIPLNFLPEVQTVDDLINAMDPLVV